MKDATRTDRRAISHVWPPLTATRRGDPTRRTLDKAPSETVRAMLEQLGNAASAGVKAASEAGSQAWNEGSAAA